VRPHGYRLSNTSIDSLSLSFPPDTVIESVTGAPVMDWKESAGDESKTVTVGLDEKRDRDFSISVAFNRDLASGTASITPPVPVVMGVNREKGWIGISADDNMEIGIGATDGTAAVDVSELPSSIVSGETFLGFKYLSRPFGLQLDVARNEKAEALDSIVDLAAYTTLVLEDGKRLTMSSFKIRSNSMRFFRTTLPEDAEVWSSYVDGKPVSPYKNPEGKLLVPLPPESGIASSDVELLFFRKRGAMDFSGRLQVDVPLPDIPVTLMMWEVYAPADYDYFGIGGNLDMETARPMIRVAIPVFRTVRV